MKKSTIVVLTFAVLLASCSKKNKEEAHQSSHTAKVYFSTSSNHNISSFNVYNNDNLVMQLASTSTPTKGEYNMELNEITEHPYSLSIDVEPLFMDSANADINLAIELWVDDEKVAENIHSSVTYGETAQLLYSGQ